MAGRDSGPGLGTKVLLLVVGCKLSVLDGWKIPIWANLGARSHVAKDKIPAHEGEFRAPPREPMMFMK